METSDAPFERVCYVDVHGTVADLHTPWLRRFNERRPACYGNHGKTFAPVTVDAITDYDIASCIPNITPHENSVLYSLLEHEGLYGEMLPIPGALDAVTRLREDYNLRVIFVTAARICVAEANCNWLKHHGFVHYEGEVIFTAQKHMLIGDFIVDDRAETLLNVAGHGSITHKAILFDQPWNRDLTKMGHRFASAAELHLDRAVGWDAVVAHIDECLERKESTRRRIMPKGSYSI